MSLSILKRRLETDARGGYRKGGGGGGQAYYENANRLYGAQADAADWQLGLAKQYVPGLLNSMMGDTELSREKQDRMAGEATAAIEQANRGAVDSFARQANGLGVDTNKMGNALADTSRSTALQRAAVRPNITRYNEDMSWARRSDMLNAANGQASNAATGLASSANGMASMGNQINANNAANARGYGMMGAMAANSMFGKDGWFADGGLVDKEELHLAAGGGVTPPSWRSRPVSGPQFSGPSTADAVGQFASGMAPRAAMWGLKQTPFGQAAKDLINPIAGNIKGNINAGMETVGNGMREAFGGTPKHVYTPTTSEAYIDSGGMGKGLGSASSAEAGTSGVADMGLASTVDTGIGTGADLGFGSMLGETGGAAVGEAAGAGAGALEGAEVGSTMGPWGAAAGAVIGGLMSAFGDDLFAKGGAVKRRDFRPGGKVNGPGTETSDSVPAHLSDGEYVLNAEAVKLIGKDKLDALNQQGLAVRDRAEPRLSSGGSVSAARAFVERTKDNGKRGVRKQRKGKKGA